YSAAYLDVLVLTSLSHPLCFALIFPFNDTATTEIYTLSLHDALPILLNNIFYKSKVLSDDERSEIRDLMGNVESDQAWGISASRDRKSTRLNSSHVSISYAVFCLKKKRQT